MGKRTMNDPRSARDVPAPRPGTKEWEKAAHQLARIHCIIQPCPHCEMPVNHRSPHESRCTWCQKVVPCLDSTPVEPSPREAFRDIVAKLEEMRDGARLTYQQLDDQGNYEDARQYWSHACAHDNAITLIRSMAGHLMEGNEQ